MTKNKTPSGIEETFTKSTGLFGVLGDINTQIGDWCLYKSIKDTENYYVIIEDIKVLPNPNGSKIYYGRGQKKTVEEYRAMKIDSIIEK